MCSTILLIFAYSSGLIGSVLAAIFGLPRTDVYHDGTEPLLASMGPEITEKNVKKWKYHSRISRFGLALIALGFLLQGVELWLR